MPRVGALLAEGRALGIQKGQPLMVGAIALEAVVLDDSESAG
jgi:hypothetical protein